MSKVFGLFSIPDSLSSAASPSDLKRRLDWGEPALTIVDIRSRAAFNESHIVGAVSIPDAILVQSVSASLELERDIYVCGENNELSSAAVRRLREAGYQSVAELTGGLPAWKAINGAVESYSMSAV
ncbi:MAG: rhodanese-like domain-containing protein [Cyanobacteria bacterium J06581_3]